MTEETNALLRALNKLDDAMVEAMLGLLEDTLSVDEHVRFSRMFLGVGTLLQETGQDSAGSRRQHRSQVGGTPW